MKKTKWKNYVKMRGDFFSPTYNISNKIYDNGYAIINTIQTKESFVYKERHEIVLYINNKMISKRSIDDLKSVKKEIDNIFAGKK